MRDKTWAKLQAPAVKCSMCGKMVKVGDWPYCASDRNPAGHERGTYSWRDNFSMKTQGWTRRMK